jgi:hypothetical protein
VGGLIVNRDCFSLDERAHYPPPCGVLTLIFRALQLRQPPRDFLCERRVRLGASVRAIFLGGGGEESLSDVDSGQRVGWLNADDSSASAAAAAAAWKSRREAHDRLDMVMVVVVVVVIVVVVVDVVEVVVGRCHLQSSRLA